MNKLWHKPEGWCSHQAFCEQYSDESHVVLGTFNFYITSRSNEDHGINF